MADTARRALRDAKQAAQAEIDRLQALRSNFQMNAAAVDAALAGQLASIDAAIIVLQGAKADLDAAITALAG